MSEQAAIGKIRDGGEDAGYRAIPGEPADFTAGEALVQPSLNRISLHGRVAQVEPKVMQVLVLMASRPGAVIARDAFLGTVWAGTVGDDYLLNRAVSELRKVLDDDPQAPCYIETIRKGGYRLIAPIAPARVASAVASPPTGSPGVSATPAPHPPTPAPPAAAPAFGARIRAFSSPGRRLGAASAIAVGVAVLLALLVAPSSPDGPSGAAAGYETLPLTSYLGREVEPALSPDGSRIAFVREDGGGRDVFVKTIGSEDLLNLSRSAAEERHPLWSADGRAVLFARRDDAGISIMRASALGGGATRVLSDPEATDVRGMALSPDGTRIAYAARGRADAPWRIVLAGIQDGQRRVVTTPPAGTLGDVDPRFTPAGDAIVFVRGVNEVTRDIHRVFLDGGAPVRLTFDNRKINGLAWSPDGDRLLFTSSRSGMYGLWSMDPDGGELQAIALGNENVHQPTTAPGVDAIAYEQWTHRSRLRQVDLARPSDPGPGEAIASTRWDSSPAWSPDGERLAFASNRNGPYGIWISRGDGREAVQIAHFDGAFIDNPAWSPDGSRIAFDGSPDGQTAIFTIPPEGGTPRRVTTGPGDSRNPAWSRDGEWLYFESNRSGQWRIHALPADSASAARQEPVAITAGPAVNARESVDGRHLLYGRPDAPGLWQRPREDWHATAAGTAGTLLVPGLDAGDGDYWAPAPNGIYYLRRREQGPPMLARFDPLDASTTDITGLPPAFEGSGFDLSADGTRLVFSELTMRESDLRLATPR